MPSRYVTITSLEELKKLGPTVVVEWSDNVFTEPASPAWWENDDYYNTRDLFITRGYFRYLVEEDEESA